eukprot:5837506-Prorocentrum_lima.AAC.1
MVRRCRCCPRRPLCGRQAGCGPSRCSVAWTSCGTSRSWTVPRSWGRGGHHHGLCAGAASAGDARPALAVGAPRLL